MNKRRQGLSNREYARRARVSAPYIQKLVTAGKLPTLPDGSLDPVACDAARARNTVMGRGQRRLRRNMPDSGGSSSDGCHACGEFYSVNVSRYYGTQDPLKYCSQRCESDAAAGLTRGQIRRKIGAEARAV